MGCKKNEEGISINRFGIDPVENVDALNKVLQMEGHYYEGDIPAKRLILDNVDYSKIPGYDVFFILENDNIIFKPGDNASIPFSIFIIEPSIQNPPLQLDNSGSLTSIKIDTGYLQVKGAKGYWKVPIESKGLRYFINFKIPPYIKEGDFTFNFTIKISGKIPQIGNLDAIPEVKTIENTKLYVCGDSIIGRGIGLHFYNLDLGDKKRKITIRCILSGSTTAGEALLGDRVDIKYNGKYVQSTGLLLPDDRYPTCKPGDPELEKKGFLDTYPLPGHYKELFFDYDPAVSKNAKIQVYGNCNSTSTVFVFIIKCPN